MPRRSHIATHAQLSKKLASMCGREGCPDALLFASIIALALIDITHSSDGDHIRTARHYIFGGQMQKHCEAIGVNYEFLIDRTSLIFSKQAQMNKQTKKAISIRLAPEVLSQLDKMVDNRSKYIEWLIRQDLKMGFKPTKKEVKK